MSFNLKILKEKIISFLKKFRLPIPESIKKGKLAFIAEELPKKDELQLATKTFSSREKFFFVFFSFLFILSTTFIAWYFNEKYLVEKPMKGGEIIEGVADTPRFINPLLATGEADRDLSILVYSGLLRPSSEDKYVEDLAESYEVSEDNLTYTVKIKENAFWHDGNPVTADDVKFTVEKAKDPVIRSPKRAIWEGVELEVVSEKIIKFTLKQNFSSFLENLTMGIIPKHKWKNVDSNNFVHSENNLKAVGSGPFKIKKIIKQTTTGIPESIELIPFDDFTLGKPLISRVTLKFYPNQEKLYEAYKKGYVLSVSALSPKIATEIKKKSDNITTSDLPRVFAVFFNQSESKVLEEKKVREALDVAIDKRQIIDTVLAGFGNEIDGPIPKGSMGFVAYEGINLPENIATGTPTTTPEYRIFKAKEILEKNGWKPNKDSGILEKKLSNKETVSLEIELSTIDISELKQASEIIKNTWEKIGAKVNLKIYERGDLDKNVIEPRKYQALFFGQVVGRGLDLFSFWHSSQRKSPGVNISSYTNTKTDKILEDIRKEKDIKSKIELIEKFKVEIGNDIPASFIYSPNFLYLVPSDIKNIKIAPPLTSSDRFLNIHEWYIKTERVWSIFL